MSKKYKRNDTLLVGVKTTAAGVRTEYPVTQSVDWNQTSAGHPWFSQNVSHAHNIGGDFGLTKSDMEYHPSATQSLDWWSGGVKQTDYIGGFVPNAPKVSAVLPGEQYSNLAARGFHKLKPTKPSFDGLTSLLEMRDIPRLLKTKLEVSGLKDVGNLYLAIQFGFLPLLRDIQDLYKAQQTMERRVSWLIRNNGKPVRSRAELLNQSSSTSVTSTSTTGGYLWPLVPPGWKYVGTHSKLEVTTTTHRVWASGRFRYWLPADPKGVVYPDVIKRRLLGLSLSPALIYKAMPWTWLVDWFTGVGTMIRNLEGEVADRLAADYFYVMEHRDQRVYTECVSDICRTDNTDRRTIECSFIRILTSKSRHMGTPFGFTWPTSLSPMQLSILGALAVQRS